MHFAVKFVGAALAAVLVLAGCGGGDSEGPEAEAAAFLEDADPEQAAEMRALMAQGPVAAASCRAGRPCRLAGSVVAKGRADFTMPGCSTLTSTVSGGAIVNASFIGSLQRAGRYNVRVSTGTFRITTKTSAMTCQVPGSPPITVPAPLPTTVFMPARVGNVVVTSDGHRLTVVDTLLGAPPPGCTGGNRFTGTVIGLSNPMVTLTGTMTCNIAGATATVTHTVKLVGAP
ncbi:hypothetical protein WG902_22045 [Ramlibacter sp. PS3R-8]|uniref:hypothetical protein n=1 Tax=Ramlibacter sp. PS3R-8 TaxID=3133437 RepID=UPI0030B7F187